MQLENAGYEAQSADSLDKALKILEKEKFDCILLDMNLHTDSGKDIILILKESPKHINYSTPIIIVSGDLNIELIKEVRDKIASVLVKPFNTSDLTEKISKSINQAQVTKQNKNSAEKTKSIFIVDDDKEYLNSIKDFLQSERFQVITSASSHEAVVKLQNQKFDTILVDLDIDHHNGEWIINLLRNDSGHLNHKTPIIIVTGFSNLSTPIVKEKVQQIIEKPVSFAELSKTINQEISISRASLVKSI